MDYIKLESIIQELPNYRKQQIYQAIFAQLIEDWQEASVLPKELREKLNQECPLKIKHELIVSHDKNTLKAALTLADGEEIETVLMLQKDRASVCVSCQVGCSMNCAFCATGKMGFKRNLYHFEILEQVLLFQRLLHKKNKQVTNVVFMGMGEPFLNYDQVMKAISFLNNENFFNIGARKISVSTSGIIPGIIKFSQEKLQLNLAFSMHAPNDFIRKSIMPVATNYSLSEILKALKKYLEKTNRKVMIEYLMLDRINDSIKNAQELAQILQKYLPPLFVINLITYNKTETNFQPATDENIKNFADVLRRKDIEVVQRFRQGRDIQGACGQLIKKRKFNNKE